jgi:uncharacterized protein (DUF2147 family)
MKLPGQFLRMCALMTGLALPEIPAGAASTSETPTGIWISFDDMTGQPEAEVKLVLVDSVLTGTVVKDLETPATQSPLVCSRCTDDRKGKPVVGLEIIRHAKYNASSGAWENGEILDPDNGQTYPLQIKLLEGGKKLQVRGYVGAFYRTQIWKRVA